jgi:hypothetical protein
MSDLPFHTDETHQVDAEWLTYGKTMEASAIRLHFACEELGRTIGKGLRSWGEAWRRGRDRQRARRQAVIDNEGGQQ